MSNNYEFLDLIVVFKIRRSFYRYLLLFLFINYSLNENYYIVILLWWFWWFLLDWLLLLEVYICFFYYFEVFEYNFIVVYMLSFDINYYVLFLFYKGVWFCERKGLCYLKEIFFERVNV